ncbi:PEP-CTERM sorting domain-containing protein [Cyanothece sp. BG0011]|uniref:PEP-CTERM sorting domain-containing protein n=1 Tax=Cyanothece sp. BG0011 TaxID=2082950 RepID=UPI000D1D7ED7|nr:PEP-CTERM sorting domain-containing protein [Cyanothece sp. BG0011]
MTPTKWSLVNSVRGLYINIHTSTVSGGEVRGQIQPVPERLTILGAGSAIAFGTGFKRKLGKAKKA